MRVSYQHANPSRGNESFLLRFHERTQTSCVLVDTGDGVDIEELLGEDEYLDAIVLTHAHLDHYRTLAENHCHGAAVYVSPATEAMLETVLHEGARNYGIGDAEAILDKLVGIHDWTDVTANVAIRPVPAGHTPGAAGFLFRFEDGIDTHHMLATGDFTQRRAGGYPGFTTDLPDVECAFVVGATNDGFEDELTESVGTAVKRAREGASVLVTAGGLTGVQYAYLLGHLGERFDRPLPVTLVGHAAKLSADLGYDVPNVEIVPEYDDPHELLAPGAVTIAGPEVPRDGSAGRLFDVVRRDSSAALVQMVSGGSEPVASAGCTVYDYELSNHPPETEIDAVIETLLPIQVVITHQRQQASRRYKDKYDSFVWTTDGNGTERDLYSDGRWLHPPWLKEWTVRTIRGHHRRSDRPTGDGSVPGLDRATDADLAAEGLGVDDVRERLYLTPDGRTTGTDSDVAAETTNETPAMTDPSLAAETPAGTDDTPETDPKLSAVLSRLDAIEAAVSPDTVRARVVDAGDGVTLLRPVEDLELRHGEVVELAIRSGLDAGEATERATANGATGDDGATDGRTDETG